jgi:hypothetical protein
MSHLAWRAPAVSDDITIAPIPMSSWTLRCGTRTQAGDEHCQYRCLDAARLALADALSKRQIAEEVVIAQMRLREFTSPGLLQDVRARSPLRETARRRD